MRIMQPFILVRISCLMLLAIRATSLRRRTVLDLSYLHDSLDADGLVKEYRGVSEDNVLLDISNANLGDAGFKKAFSDILFDGQPTSRCLDLNLRMNRLSSPSAAFLLSTLANGRAASSNETQAGSVVRVRSLDIGWNDLIDDQRPMENKAFHKALEELVSSERCPTTICLECTNIGAATCRAIAKGLIRRFESTKKLPLLSLKLANNEIGDSGLAALAAAIRTICCSDDTVVARTILDTLDLSACDIGDAGIDTLALTLEEAAGNGDVIIRSLILSNNHITDLGAINLGRFFRNTDDLSLDLSSNKITDRGLATIAESIGKGMLSTIIVRSCHVHADGAELIGKSLRAFCTNPKTRMNSVKVDLSGNPIGLLRGKSKSEGSKYSASKLKSTATATASAYMNQGLSFLKKGLESAGFASTAESDDEEEKEGNVQSEQQEDDSSKKRCGFKSMANAFIGEGDTNVDSSDRRIALGLRRTFCDTAGSEALAAMLVTAEDEMPGVKLELDLQLNPVLEESSLQALGGQDDDLLREMADRHTEAMAILRRANERAEETARLATARLEAKRGYDSQWDNGLDEEYDSDAVYDEPEEDY